MVIVHCTLRVPFYQNYINRINDLYVHITTTILFCNNQTLCVPKHTSFNHIKHGRIQAGEFFTYSLHHFFLYQMFDHFPVCNALFLLYRPIILAGCVNARMDRRPLYQSLQCIETIFIYLIKKETYYIPLPGIMITYWKSTHSQLELTMYYCDRWFIV